MLKYLFAGVSVLALGVAAPAYAIPLGLSLDGNTSGEFTMTGLGDGAVSIGLAGTVSGPGLFTGETTTDSGTYTLSNIGPTNPVNTGVNSMGLYTLSPPMTLDLSWTGSDGDSMTGTASFNLVVDGSLAPQVESSGFPLFNFTVDTSSGDSDFTTLFPVGSTREMDFSWTVPTSLDQLSTGTGSISAGVSAGEVTTPAPAIGHGLPAALAIGGLLVGAGLWERKKRVSPKLPAAA